MTKRRHLMPFGTEILPNGLVRFRFWAPDAKRVNLFWRSQNGEGEIAMNAVGGGWYSIETALKGGCIDYGFRINGGPAVPDLASRFQAHDVHGLSRLIDPAAWNWQDSNWLGRPWEDAVIYELHIGTFTPSGNFMGVISKLEYLIALGVTAIQLMPVADFPGQRNWGYDGVLPFAPDSRYGMPDELKLLVQTAHGKGLMVFLDVVYNHFGPEGNYLHGYAAPFFSARHRTPWGEAINFDAEASANVRQFFIHNALYWLEEYHLDGLRFDSAHAIFDDSEKSIWEEIAQAVHEGPGASRHIHLILENDNNAAHLLRRYANSQAYTAQWNDDFHHAMHVLLTGEVHGYYGDYTRKPLWFLGRCLTLGFAYQGEASAYRKDSFRGEPSSHLPPTAFIGFLQNHDQIGNRPNGERLTMLTSSPALRAATAVFLLAPPPPLMFMGQEWGCTQPFCYFCDFEPALNEKVWEGRRREFAEMPGLQGNHTPDPASYTLFERCRLDWSVLDDAGHRSWLDLHRDLLKIRQAEIVPRLQAISGNGGQYRLLAARVIQAEWLLGDSSQLMLAANLGYENATVNFLPLDRLLYASHEALSGVGQIKEMPPWSVAWFLQPGSAPP